jgi:hypothetical protein
MLTGSTRLALGSGPGRHGIAAGLADLEHEGGFHFTEQVLERANDHSRRLQVHQVDEERRLWRRVNQNTPR